jgi:hypothetical protein
MKSVTSLLRERGMATVVSIQSGLCCRPFRMGCLLPSGAPEEAWALVQERALCKPIAPLSIRPEDPCPDPRSGGRLPA